MMSNRIGRFASTWIGFSRTIRIGRPRAGTVGNWRRRWREVENYRMMTIMM